MANRAIEDVDGRNRHAATWAKLQQFILREESAWPPEKMMSTKVLLNFDKGDHGLSKEELNVIFNTYTKWAEGYGCAPAQ